MKKCLFVCAVLLGCFTILTSWPLSAAGKKKSKVLNSIFYIENERVYVVDVGDPQPLNGVDLKTFKLACPDPDCPYAKDTKNVYHLTEKVAGADTRTFKALNSKFAIDAKNVYSNGQVIEDAKVASFTPFDAIYAKDADHVFIETVDKQGTIEGADPKTFEVFTGDEESAYTKDSKRVYFFGEPVPNADPKTFEQVTERFGKDKNHVYSMKKILPAADVANFHGLKGNVWLGADQKNVYYGDEIFKDADPATLKSLPKDLPCGPGCYYRYEDKNHKYKVDRSIVP